MIDVDYILGEIYMLNIYIGVDSNALLDVNTYFKYAFIPEWFKDDLVREMIRDVDKSEVIGEEAVRSPYLGVISPDRLSGGVKTCILLLKEENFYPDLVNCGENCCKWLTKIANMRDISASISGLELWFNDCDIRAHCLNDNTDIIGDREWKQKLLDISKNWEDWHR